MKTKKCSALFFTAAFAVSLLLSGCASDAPPVSNTPPAEDAAQSGGKTDTGTASKLGVLKSFTADTLDGGVFTQDDIMNRDVTVINFWSTTCGPCIAEMPDLAAFAEALPDNVAVITVCLDGARVPDTAKELLNKAGFEGTTLITGSEDLIDVCRNIQYTPTTVFVDNEGNLAGDAIIGGQKDLSETFLKAINSVLNAEGKEEISLEE